MLNFAEVNTYLLLHKNQIFQNWLPGGHIEGDTLVALNPTRIDHHKGSFRINAITGQWIDFATSDSGGDLISLYAYLNNLSQGEAVKYLNKKLDLKNFTQLKVIASKAPKVSKVNNSVFKKIWKECGLPQNTLAEKYLQIRGYVGDIPQSIRFHPKLYHHITQSHHPAMVAAIQECSRKEVIGIHRTYLKSDGSGKADITPNKMMLGITKGGAVQFSDTSKTLVLAEGIESALSVYLSTSLTTWATLSTSGLVNVKVPSLDITNDIIIAADNDLPGIKAAHSLMNRLLGEGYSVRVALPDKGSDFNDMLRR